MFALQKTITKPAGGRLQLDLPLPDTVTAGWMEVQVLIQPLPSKPPQTEPARKHISAGPIRWGRGSCKNMVKPGGVERFLAECHADKERELAMEERQRQERKRYAGTASS